MTTTIWRSGCKHGETRVTRRSDRVSSVGFWCDECGGGQPWTEWRVSDAWSAGLRSFIVYATKAQAKVTAEAYGLPLVRRRALVRER